MKKVNQRSSCRVIIAGLFSALLMASCVPARKYQDCNDSLKKSHMETSALQSEHERVSGQLEQCENELSIHARASEKLKRDTAYLASALEMQKQKNEQLNKTYELLLAKNKELLSDNRVQTERISTELSQAQEQLIRKEDALKKLEIELNETATRLSDKETALDELSTNLQQSKQGLDASAQELEESKAALEAAQTELLEKQQKLIELQRILMQKDSMVTALRQTVTEALLGFTDKGLKIEERNGKVYVSLDNKLLFASGSIEVGSEGNSALKEIALVLEKNPEISVMVEGHTDDVPLRGSGEMKDNWDLSVLRATAIVKILLSSGKIEPSRITAAGRSQYLPVETGNSAEARAKNRRTEIILTPRLDELFKVIESN